MSQHFINLNCANCGAKLDIYDDIEHFSCGYCGTQLIVQRRGGTVALKAVKEAIQKVQIGTDKTAAELALVRIEKESSELKAKLAAVERRMSGKGCQIGCLVLVVILFEFFFIAGGDTGFAVGLLVMLAVMLPIAHHYERNNERQSKQKQEVADLTAKLEKLNQEADEHRRFLESKQP